MILTPMALGLTVLLCYRIDQKKGEVRLRFIEIRRNEIEFV